MPKNRGRGGKRRRRRGRGDAGFSRRGHEPPPQRRLADLVKFTATKTSHMPNEEYGNVVAWVGQKALCHCHDGVVRMCDWRSGLLPPEDLATSTLVLVQQRLRNDRGRIIDVYSDADQAMLLAAGELNEQVLQLVARNLEEAKRRADRRDGGDGDAEGRAGGGGPRVCHSDRKVEEEDEDEEEGLEPQPAGPDEYERRRSYWTVTRCERQEWGLEETPNNNNNDDDSSSTSSEED